MKSTWNDTVRKIGGATAAPKPAPPARKPDPWLSDDDRRRDANEDSPRARPRWIPHLPEWLRRSRDV